MTNSGWLFYFEDVEEARPWKFESCEIPRTTSGIFLEVASARHALAWQPSRSWAPAASAETSRSDAGPPGTTARWAGDFGLYPGDELHAQVTTEMIELTACNVMRLLHELQTKRARMAFRQIGGRRRSQGGPPRL